MFNGLTFHISTVGCRLNQAESDALRGYLLKQGAKPVDFETRTPDLLFINTCAVTATAERTSLTFIRAGSALKPKPRLIILGCLVARTPELIAAIPGVDEYWPSELKNRILAGQTPVPARSRALLKVQDGCDHTCAYCIVRKLRGAPISIPPEQVLDQFEQLLNSGYQEIVLTGLNLGLYQSTGTNLARLIKKLLKKPGNFRLRLASIEPDLFTDELLALLPDPKICAHFHIPLQSGDDLLLKQMGRNYTTSDYARLLEKILTLRPDACLGADIITGFPGEDEPSFNRTCQFLNSIPFTYLHVFPYSPRPDTPAFKSGDPIPKPVKKQRVKILRHFSENRRRQYARKFAGTRRYAILEPDGQALTDNYLRLTCPNVPRFCRAGALVPLLINLAGEKLIGTIEEEKICAIKT
jgi:threonylcarbamoyladenosine tRNA methylthiotransferase MtaB